MSSEAQSVLVMLLGTVTLRLSSTDAYLRYVKEGLRPFLLVSGLLLVAIGVVSLWRDVVLERSGGPVAGTQVAGTQVAGTEQGEADYHAVHDHAHGPAVAWLLVLPVLAIFLVAPPALGAYAAGRGSSTVAKPEIAYPALPSGDPVTVTLTTYAERAVWDEESLAGRTVRMRGFVTPRPSGGYYLTRITIACCAADSRPVKIAVRGTATSFAADTWIELTGRYARRASNGQVAMWCPGSKPFRCARSTRLDSPTNNRSILDGDSHRIRDIAQDPVRSGLSGRGRPSRP